jgi:iron complex transport system permease protein
MVRVMVTPAKIWSLTLVGLLALLLSGALALEVGSVFLGWGRAARGLITELGGGVPLLDPTERTILLEVRLPRILLTALVGSALSVSGVVFQALLRNPLAEPFILGLSSGAAVGALLSMALGASLLPMAMPGAAFLGALFTVALVFCAAGARGRLQVTTLLLTGVIVNAFFTAVIMLILTLSAEQQIHPMIFWLYGDLTSARYHEVALVGPLAGVAFLVILAHGRGLNLMVTGDDTAMQLGVSVERQRAVLFAVTSLLTGAVVSVSGIIGFVGLIVPHLVRMAFGSDHRLLLPLAALWGGVFLVLADAVARVVLAPGELPVGVVTAALGAPFFMLLLRQRGSRWSLS